MNPSNTIQSKAELPPKFEHFVAPLPIVVVGTQVNSKPNYNAVGNFGLLCINPLTIYISLNSGHYTAEGIRNNHYFSVNVPNTEVLDKTDYVGLVSGRKVDKSTVFTNMLVTVNEAKVPIPTELPVSFVCELIKIIPVHHMELMIGEIKKIFIDSNYISNNAVNLEEINPSTLFLGQEYRELGEIVGKPYSIGESLKK